MICPKCGHQIDTNKDICLNCGTKINSKDNSKLMYITAIGIIIVTICLGIYRNSVIKNKISDTNILKLENESIDQTSDQKQSNTSSDKLMIESSTTAQLIEINSSEEEAVLSVESYLIHLNHAINSGHFGLVERFIEPGSNLYVAQTSLVERLYSKSITEELIDFDITKVTKLSDILYEVSAREKIGINKPSGYAQYTYYYTYTVMDTSRGHKLSDIRQTPENEISNNSYKKNFDYEYALDNITLVAVEYLDDTTVKIRWNGLIDGVDETCSTYINKNSQMYNNVKDCLDTKSTFKIEGNYSLMGNGMAVEGLGYFELLNIIPYSINYEKSDQSNTQKVDIRLENYEEVLKSGAKFQCTYPIVTGITDAEFQNTLNQYFKQEMEDFKNNFYNEAEVSNELDFGNNIEIKTCNNELLSIINNKWMYTGGAHTMPLTVAYNIDLKNKKELLLSDCINNVKDIENSFIEQINSKSDLYDGLYDSPLLNVDKERDFYFSEEKLIVFYEQYEIGPYSMGVIEFGVPNELIR